MIYFTQNTATKAIKIGYSKNPKKRRDGLQTASPDPLVVIGTMHGGLEHERWLHDRFAKHRIKGEWFRGEILTEVRQILAKHPTDKPPPSNVVVVGDRDIRDRGVVLAALDQLHAGNPIAWVITGGDQELDRWAWEWARLHEAEVYRYLPNWRRHGRGAPTEVGKRLIRSMFDPKSFLVFQLDEGSSYTARLATQARKKGYEVVVNEVRSKPRMVVPAQLIDVTPVNLLRPLV